MANYVSQYTGAELDNSILFGKNPDAEPTENSNSGAKSGGIWTAIKNLATSISGKQAKITASGMLKGDGNGGVSTAVEGTDYIGTAQRGRYAFERLVNATPTMTLNQNTVYAFNGASPITTGSFTLGDFTQGVHLTSEWYVSFTAGANCSISFTYPTGYPIKWKDGTPSFTQGKVYEIDFLLQYGQLIGIVSECQ